MNSRTLAPAGATGRMLDGYALVGILPIVYAALASPLLMYLFPLPTAGDGSLAAMLQSTMDPRVENKIFWPVIFLITAMMLARNWQRLSFTPPIACLFMCLGFAGLSTLWAFKQDISFQRFILQIMVITSVVIPAMLAGRSTDPVRALFLCFGFACIINIPVVATQNPLYVNNVDIGYPGIFTFKGLLGQCAAMALLLALHEMLFAGGRRMAGLIVIAVAIPLLHYSKSKGSLAMAMIAPMLAVLALYASRATRISPALVLLPIPLTYWVMSLLVENLVSRISWRLYGNYTLSDRTQIWDYVATEIAQRPLLGWGYQSFWLIGPDAPNITNATGFIKTMPNAHNGFLDITIDMGYIGLAILVVYICITIHAIGRVAERDFRRAWILLSFALFVILTNFLESNWMRGQDVPWLMFVFVSAQTVRYWEPRGSLRKQHGPSRVARPPLSSRRRLQGVRPGAPR